MGVEALDELYSGVPSVGSAEIQAEFSASYTVTASVLLFVPGVVAFLLEPILFVLADRYPRRWFVCGGLFAMGGAGLAAALAPNVMVLSLAISVASVGSGSGVALAQATLVDARPEARERALTRWALLGELGDLAAPLLMAGTAVLGLSWRAAYVIVSVVVLLWAAALTRATFRVVASEDDDEDEEPGVFTALRAALRSRELLLWLGASALCDLLDETVVVFAALYLRDYLEANAVERSFVIGAGVAGAICGVVCTDLLLRRVPPLRLLLVACVACTLCYVGWIFTMSSGLSALLFFATGATAAPMYPIAVARAYAALPGRSGTVNAAGHVFTPLTLALPFLLGALADWAGLRVTLALLLLQPVGLFFVTWFALAKGAQSRPSP